MPGSADAIRYSGSSCWMKIKNPFKLLGYGFFWCDFFDLPTILPTTLSPDLA
tara:strand:- start:1048 stop:1203 length:156 start_codon:yes stop_codon:yes gene_type:complete